jgi:hypothetical protein
MDKEFCCLSRVNLSNLCKNTCPEICKYLGDYVAQVKKTYGLEEGQIFTRDAVYNLCMNPLTGEYAKKIIPHVKIVQRYDFFFSIIRFRGRFDSREDRYESRHLGTVKEVINNIDVAYIFETNLEKLKLNKENILDLCANSRSVCIIDTVIYLQNIHLDASNRYEPINNRNKYEIITHPNSFGYIEKLVLNIKKNKGDPLINWRDIFIYALERNSRCMLEIIEGNQDKIRKKKNLPLEFYANPNLIEMIEKQLHDINIYEYNPSNVQVYWGLCMNPKAVHILQKLNLGLFQKYNFSSGGYMLEYLCRNSNPDVLSVVRTYAPLLNKHRDYEAIMEINKSQFLWVLLDEHRHLVVEHYLFRNEHAVALINRILTQYTEYNTYICTLLCLNPNFTSINYDTFIDKFNSNCWYYLCKRQDTIGFIAGHLDKFDMRCWHALCGNPLAIHIIADNLDKLDQECWEILCTNENAIKVIARNLDKLNGTCWMLLSEMPAAVDLLRVNRDKICYNSLCLNRCGFDIMMSYNMDSVLKYKKELNQQVVEFVLSPDWIGQMCKRYNTPFIQYVTNYYS